jgi:hypothetical protein
VICKYSNQTSNQEISKKERKLAAVPFDFAQGTHYLRLAERKTSSWLSGVEASGYILFEKSPQTKALLKLGALLLWKFNQFMVLELLMEAV